MGRTHRALRRAVPDSQGAPRRARRADALRREAAGARGQRRSDFIATSEQLPTYNAYSIDGDVTGPLVYVNYGIPEDYEALEARGVSVKGAIVIARYGRSWRGIKPKVAAEHGAIGCLIYSDPADDGYAEGDVFPAGPMRPADGVQRGSVMDMPVYPGDPLTPGIGATARCQAPRAQGRDDAHEDSGAPNFLRRRTAAALGTNRTTRARRLARRSSAHVQARARRGARASRGQIRIGRPSHSTTSSRCCADRRHRTNG